MIKTLSLGKNARKYDDSMSRMEAVTGEQAPTLGKYLCHLAKQHPEPVGFDELEDVLKVTKSQVSRLTRQLHDMTASGEPGLKLVDVRFDLYNPRLKLVVLNAKGIAALESVFSDLDK